MRRIVRSKSIFRDVEMRLRLTDFLATRLKPPSLVLADQPSRGLTIVEKLERASERCCFAIILMTRDDEQANGTKRARQNVIHEIGFFQGQVRSTKRCAERGLELFTNISGIIRIEFDLDHFEEIFESLRAELAPWHKMSDG